MGLFLIIGLITFECLLIVSLINEFYIPTALICIWTTYMLCDVIDKEMRG